MTLNNDKLEKFHLTNHHFPVCMNTNTPCFCGSKANFSSCCQPYINKEKHVETAEQLMRSRFSAYAIGNAQYIFDTYAKTSQAEQSVKEIKEWSESCFWIALSIYPLAKTINKTTEQFVEFSAFYVSNNTLCELREKSRFILEECKATSIMQTSTNNNTDTNNMENSTSKQWRYIDGDIIAHNELTKIKRNDLCPCNHYPSAWQVNKGKKFKRCCGSN